MLYSQYLSTFQNALLKQLAIVDLSKLQECLVFNIRIGALLSEVNVKEKLIETDKADSAFSLSLRWKMLCLTWTK